LNFYFFDENHDVVRATKKRRNKFERRWAILCSFNEFSRFLSVFDRIWHDVSIIDSKNLLNNLLLNRSCFSSDLKCLLCVFLNDKLVLKRSSNLICLNSCQIACLVEIRSDASRCFKLWDKYVYNACYCKTNELDVNINLSCIKRLRRELIEKQKVKSVFEFFSCLNDLSWIVREITSR
jgi:hypothetical protein